jgi:sugar (pentulose or hexulose) kinase
MQIYADIIGKPMKVSQSEQTCALGAAIFGNARNQLSECLQIATFGRPRDELDGVYLVQNQVIESLLRRSSVVAWILR